MSPNFKHNFESVLRHLKTAVRGDHPRSPMSEVLSVSFPMGNCSAQQQFLMLRDSVNRVQTVNL